DDRQHHPAPGHQPPVRPCAQRRGGEPGVLPARFADLWRTRADLPRHRRRHRTAPRADLRGLIDAAPVAPACAGAAPQLPNPGLSSRATNVLAARGSISTVNMIPYAAPHRCALWLTLSPPRRSIQIE